ncbi:MAG TPA: hypothetical protein VHE61_02855 [Opitutaceae bacterium]|nr:hypothetical protein [Opitutaceae bacterium]
MNERRIEIIGGGLAGLALGLALRRDSIPVTILEAGTYPRHRVCGEFIAGLDEATMATLGLSPFLQDAKRHQDVAWFTDGCGIRTQALPEPAWGISRYTLDARLADAFRAAGGDLRMNSRAPDLSPRAGRVLSTGRRPGRSPWLGLKVHVRDLSTDHDLEVHLGDHAYVGLSAVEDGAVNVCGLFRRQRAAVPLSPRPRSRREPWHMLLDHLEDSGLGGVADRLRNASVDRRSFCAVAALDFTRHASPLNRISLGDSWAMIPPFTGNGMAMAFQSAASALNPIREYVQGRASWAEACRKTNAALRRRFRLRLLSARALHPFLLRPPRQQWLAWLGRAGLLPMRPLYAALH